MLIGNRKENVIRKSHMLSEISLTAILNQKIPNMTHDMNPVCSDSMPLLYHLRHSHCPLFLE